jgi:CO dehydrogenase/acetyl-CoA synthase delta subunit
VHSITRRNQQRSRADSRITPRLEPARFAISASDFKAALTDAAFGNNSATSGSRTTTFELATSRLTYFPRTSAPKLELLYFGRSLFIGSAASRVRADE